MAIFLGILSAIFAALVTIFGKLGVKSADPIFLTTIRSFIMTLFLIATTFSLGKFSNSFSFSGKEWMYIVFAGVAGALSWICYFSALKFGSANLVAALDRGSIILIFLASALFLGEAFTYKTIIGSILIFTGLLFVVFK